MTADQDLRAEQATLGAIMLSGGRALDDIPDFDPADHYRPQHEELHRAFLAMAKRNEPIDETSTAGVLATIRGCSPDYFVDLSQACTAWSSVAFFAGKVSRAATLRRAREVGVRLTGLDPALALSADNLDSALDDAKADLGVLGVARHSGVTTFADVADGAIDSIGTKRFTPTPWNGLNHLIRGWSPSQKYVIAARPGTGKTVVAVQAAIHAAMTSDIGVAYYTFEMNGERLYQRALANIAKVDMKKIMDGVLSEAEWRALSRADQEVLRDLPVVVEGAAGWSAQQVVSHAKVAHRKRPLGLVFIDHIGRVASGSERSYSREQHIADADNRFLDMAHHLDAAVVVCSQLNRGPSQRSDPKPIVTDIRESDVIEQNADCVILLHRDRDKTPSDLDAIVAKNRDGMDDTAPLTFEGHYSRAIDREWTPSHALRN